MTVLIPSGRVSGSRYVVAHPSARTLYLHAAAALGMDPVLREDPSPAP